MPATSDRQWIAAVLTAQIAIGASLGLVAQVAIVIGVIWYLMAWLGLDLLDLSRALADFDVPRRLADLF